MDPIQVYMFTLFIGIFSAFFLIKGVRGLVQGRFVTMTKTAGALSFLNYSWARSRLEEEGEPFYEVKEGSSARVWSLIYTGFGLALALGLGVLWAFYYLQPIGT